MAATNGASQCRGGPERLQWAFVTTVFASSSHSSLSFLWIGCSGSARALQWPSTRAVHAPTVVTNGATQHWGNGAMRAEQLALQDKDEYKSMSKFNNGIASW